MSDEPDVDLDALERALAAAKTGPWATSQDDARLVVTAAHRAGDPLAVAGYERDAALIVAAVNALPGLVAEVRRLRAMREPAAALLDLIPRCRGPYGTIGEGSLVAVLGTGRCRRPATHYLANGADYSDGACARHATEALPLPHRGVYALPWGVALAALAAALGEDGAA